MMKKKRIFKGFVFGFLSENFSLLALSGEGDFCEETIYHRVFLLFFIFYNFKVRISHFGEFCGKSSLKKTISHIGFFFKKNFKVRI